MRITTVNFTDETIKGTIDIQILPGRERLGLLKKIKLTPDQSGVLHFTDETVDALIAGSSIVCEKIDKIDLEINGEKINNFEDLEYSVGFNTVVMRLIGVMLNGPEKLGNLQLRQLKIKS